MSMLSPKETPRARAAPWCGDTGMGTLVWGHSETIQNIDIHQMGTASTSRMLQSVHDTILALDDLTVAVTVLRR